MKWCIRCNSDYGLGRYVSEDGFLTNDLSKILVTAANNVLRGACESWKRLFHQNYEVVEFDVDKIRKDLKVCANQD